jgi:hypothetical protein
MPLDIAQNKQMIWELIKAYHDAVDKRTRPHRDALTPDVSLVLSMTGRDPGPGAGARALRTDARATLGPETAARSRARK